MSLQREKPQWENEREENRAQGGETIHCLYYYVMSPFIYYPFVPLIFILKSGHFFSRHYVTALVFFFFCFFFFSSFLPFVQQYLRVLAVCCAVPFVQQQTPNTALVLEMYVEQQSSNTR